MHEIFPHNCNYSLLVIKYMYVTCMLEIEIKKMYVTNARNSFDSIIFV